MIMFVFVFFISHEEYNIIFVMWMNKKLMKITFKPRANILLI